MAARSRLGRDPLSNVAMPTAGKTSRPVSKAKTPRKAPAKDTPVRGSNVLPEATTVPGPESTAGAEAQPKQSVVEPDARQNPDVAATIAGPETIQIPAEAAALEPAHLEPTASETAVSEPVDAEMGFRQIPEALTPLPSPGQATDSTPAVLDAAPSKIPSSPSAAAITPPPCPDQEPHPVEVFLRGVLEGLAPEGTLTLAVVVDPEANALPVEKLFYFSHALQLLIAPLDQPGNSWRRPREEADRIAALYARLHGLPGGRHALRLYDNGLFFRSYLQEISLEMEALRPLMLFVVKRHGSICLKQGHCVEFEIIG